MKTINYVLAVFWKEIQLMLKEGGALAIFFLLPLLLSSLMGGINVMTTTQDTAVILLRVSLVNADSGPFGSEVAKAIGEIKELEVMTYDTASAAEERVAKGEATAAIFIPAEFSSNIDDHTPTVIDVIVDPGEPQSASIVTGIMNQVVAEVTIWGEVQYGIRSLMETSGVLDSLTLEEQGAVGAQALGVIMTVLNEMRRTPVIAVASESLEAAGDTNWLPTFFAFMFSGFTVMFIFINASWSSGSLLDERESGTLRRLLAAPIPRGAILVGKMLAFLLLSCMQVVVMFTVASVFFDMALGQSPLALVVVTLVVALTSTAMGMLIAALSKSADKAGTAGVIIGIVLAGIGGCIGSARVPLTRAEGFTGMLARLTPQGHAVNAYYSVMAENATLVQVLPQLGIMLAMCAVFYVIAVWRFKFEV